MERCVRFCECHAKWLSTSKQPRQIKQSRRKSVSSDAVVDTSRISRRAFRAFGTRTSEWSECKNSELLNPSTKTFRIVSNYRQYTSYQECWNNCREYAEILRLNGTLSLCQLGHQTSHLVLKYLKLSGCCRFHFRVQFL
jgi:hypothetical protein